jgi:hypothetical protein
MDVHKNMSHMVLTALSSHAMESDHNNVNRRRVEFADSEYYFIEVPRCTMIEVA